MNKIIKITVAIVFLVLLGYLFLWPADYIVRFKENANVGTINQSLKLWDFTQDTLRGIEQEGDLNHLSQLVKSGDSIYELKWILTPESDTITKVKVYITDQDWKHSISNRFQVLLGKTPFTKNAEQRVMDFAENLRDHTKKIKVTIVGEEDFPAKYLAYIPEKTKQMQKAGGMMKHFSYLSNELYSSGSQLDGPPIIEVTYWNQERDSIHFNFGQPIIRSEKLPMGTDIQYKRIFDKRALKAIYNGNYITSDRAWYALLDYAKKEGIEVEPLPIEVFYNNPNTGADEINWKAEVYMPIKEKK